MIKNWYRLSIVWGIIGVTALGCLQIYSILQEKKRIQSNISHLDNIPIVALDGSHVEFESGQPVLLVLFNSECIICQHEARDMYDHIDGFAGFRIFMISSEPVGDIDRFAVATHLKSRPEVVFAHVRPQNVYPLFGNSPVPSFFIYDEDKLLIRKFAGETKAETLIKHLSRSDSI